MAEPKKSILYRDDRIEISQREYPEEHDLIVDGDKGAYCLLQRGVLNDLARRQDIESFRQSMHAMNDNFVYKLEQIKMPLEIIAWAFSKARMAEIEQEADYFRNSKRKVRELRQDLSSL